MINSRKLLSSSLFQSSQLCSFHPPTQSIHVARSKHRLVFDHTISKQMFYFLRRADEGDGTPRTDEANAKLEALQQSQ